MAEVFTISGAMLGASSGPAAQLQSALNALSAATSDKALKVGVDGIIGPKTVAALNYAFQNYGGSTKTDWTVADVRQSLVSLVGIVSSVVRQHGGTDPRPKKKASSGGGASVADLVAAQQATQKSAYDLFTEHPNLVWWVVGGAGVVLTLGFMAARKRHQAAAARPAPV